MNKAVKSSPVSPIDKSNVCSGWTWRRHGRVSTPMCQTALPDILGEWIERVMGRVTWLLDCLWYCVEPACERVSG